VRSDSKLARPRFAVLLSSHILLMVTFQARLVRPTMARTAPLLVRWTAWGLVLMRSPRMRYSESTHNLNTECVAMIHESAFEAAIMNMTTICSRAACSTSEPSRIARVIMPGIAMMPITLTGKRRLGMTEAKAECGFTRTSFG
jgi:hypothetical protein